MQRSLDHASVGPETASELDLRALGALLWRARRTIIIPTVAALLLVGFFVLIFPPRYTAESQVLLENQETFFTRPDRAATPLEQASIVDPEAVGSQIQLITSRDIARRAIRDLGLKGNPEFDPAARGTSALTRVLILLRIARDPTQETVDSRILQTFADKLTVFSPPKTRVITIQFQSKDPELAALVANKMAELYIAEQSSAKRIGAREAADALSGQIADLRVKLAKADAEREQYRAASGLLAGTNNMTISGQQLADINGDLSRARASQADAQAKASLLRELIRSGKTTDVTEVVNNDLVRRVGEQRVTAQAQLAQESRTLLPGHPRIKELTAQVADLTAALKAAAKQAAAALDNEAKISGQRVANLETVLTQQKKVAGAANGDEVRLRSLDRVAQSYKDQLDSSTTKYQEALSRQTSNATPADARIIARAVVPQEPSFPKKLPFTVFGTVATLIFAIGFVIARELLGTPSDASKPVRVAKDVKRPSPSKVEPVSAPVAAPILPVMAETEPLPERYVETAAIFETPAPRAMPSPVIEPSKSAKVASDEPKTKPLSWDLNAVLEKVKAFGQSAAASRAVPLPSEEAGEAPVRGVGWDGGRAPRGLIQEPAAAEEPEEGESRSTAVEIEALANAVVAAHLPGRGLHVVGASLGATRGMTADLLALGRVLAERGRSVIVDLNAGPSHLAPLVDADRSGIGSIDQLLGLSELLSGHASFAEVIHRDHASRLHFVPTGRRDADFRDFDLVLDALSETYDFVVLLAPAFPQSDIARVMAPYADLVVLTAARGTDAQAVALLKADLIAAGAREVLVSGLPSFASAREPYVA